MGFRLEIEGMFNLKIIGIPTICSDSQAFKIIEDLFDEFENDPKKNLLVMEILLLCPFRSLLQ